jgi:sterol desaturase/sphingolipid hydroxylase (fatty acid hydroxylase superfamily)
MAIIYIIALSYTDLITVVDTAYYFRLVIRNVEYSSYQWVHKNFCLYELPWESAWTWILMVFGVDFGFYWFHRCAHG